MAAQRRSHRDERRRSLGQNFLRPELGERLVGACDFAPGELDQHALANRLSYFFWRSAPDAKLIELASAGKLNAPQALDEQVERMLADPKSQRFIDDFLGQWLKLRQIAATDPDKKLYPEFSPYLQDSMVAETRA